MNSWIIYVIIAAILMVAELLYFRIADRFNIIDKPNERSSHTKVVLRGGGIIFTIGLWIWGFTSVPSLTGEGGLLGLQIYPWMLAGVTLAAGVSFIDDIHSLPDAVRLVAQFAAMGLLLTQLIMDHGQGAMGDGVWTMSWWAWALFVAAALIVCVGATNIYNFMDGINGITGGYSLAVLVPLVMVNEQWRMKHDEPFVEGSLLMVVGLSLLVFCFFNFRKKAKCFAGDVGSIGIALILLFCIGKLIVRTGDVTWLIFMLVYGVDGCCTIIHRIMLHENLGQAHRKHAFQLMANELKIPHVVVSCIYMALQLVVSLGFIYVCPDTVLAHWCYLIGAILVLGVGYVLFMKRYYHLHEDYLASLSVKRDQ